MSPAIIRTEAIVFDLDGTLYETRALDDQSIEAVTACLSDWLAVTVEDARVKLDSARHEGVGADLEPRSVLATLQRLGLPESRLDWYQRKYMHPETVLSPDPTLVDLLRQVRSYRKLALFTNTRRPIVDRILHVLGLTFADFDKVISGEALSQAKPNSAALAELLEELETRPSDATMVGDRYHVDLQPAEELGMRTKLVAGRDDVIEWLDRHLKAMRGSE